MYFPHFLVFLCFQWMEALFWLEELEVLWPLWEWLCVGSLAWTLTSPPHFPASSIRFVFFFLFCVPLSLSPQLSSSHAPPCHHFSVSQHPKCLVFLPASSVRIQLNWKRAARSVLGDAVWENKRRFKKRESRLGDKFSQRQLWPHKSENEQSWEESNAMRWNFIVPFGKIWGAGQFN